METDLPVISESSSLPSRDSTLVFIARLLSYEKAHNYYTMNAWNNSIYTGLGICNPFSTSAARFCFPPYIAMCSSVDAK